MLDERDLQAIRALFNEEMDRKLREQLQPINKDLKEMKTDIQELKENLGEVRDATNYMVEWIERVEKKVDAAV